MKNSNMIIKEIETAFNNLLNDSIKKGIIRIEELKDIIVMPSPSYKLLHIFSPTKSTNLQYLKSQEIPIGSINISNYKNSMKSEIFYQHISERYITNHQYMRSN